MGTALIPLAPSINTEAGVCADNRPRAEFLAQLIAVRSQAPQLRLRRRAEPEVAIALYHAGDRSQTLAGRTLSRSL